MNGPGSRIDEEKITGVLAMLILGAGFLTMFAGLDAFWMIWVLGFAVLLPIVSILLGEDDEADDRGTDAGRTRRRAPDADPEREADEDDPLATLRGRYARGEIDEETFERKLEALLETETPEGARDRLSRRGRERSAEAETGRSAGVDAERSAEVDAERE